MIEFECWETRTGTARGMVVDRTGLIVDAASDCRFAMMNENGRLVERGSLGLSIGRMYAPAVGEELLGLIGRHCALRTGFLASLMDRGSWIKILATPEMGESDDCLLRCRSSLHTALLATPEGIGSVTVYRIRHVDLGPLAALSLREIEVMKLIGDGLQSVEIAKRIHRSVRTVQGHRRSIGKKLGLNTRAAIAKQSVYSGLAAVPLELLGSYLGLDEGSLPGSDEPGVGVTGCRPASV